jgi:hypothetical protein
MCSLPTRFVAVLGGVLLVPVAASAQESEQEVLVDSVRHSGYSFAVDVKFSEIDGDFTNFVGFSGGWLINHRFLIGVAGYGKTTGIDRSQMGYGGLTLEYFLRPERLWNVSIAGLIGGGAISWNWTDPFFVGEPEAKLNLNLSKRWRLSFGGGYRFVGGAPGPDERLSGFVGDVAIRFGSF